MPTTMSPPAAELYVRLTDRLRHALQFSRETNEAIAEALDLVEGRMPAPEWRQEIAWRQQVDNRLSVLEQRVKVLVAGHGREEDKDDG
jgi:hypothetical protein